MARRRRRSLFRKVLDWSVMIAGLGLLAYFIAWLDMRNPQVYSGSVQVLDGDSLVVNGERIRLQGIDAPEYNQTCDKNGMAWNCGRKARDALRGLVKQGKVTCRSKGLDRYDRSLATCEVNGRNINLSLVEQGWAIDYGGYARAERRARLARRGIWQGEFERPQEWRQSQEGDAGSLNQPDNTIDRTFDDTQKWIADKLSRIKDTIKLK